MDWLVTGEGGYVRLTTAQSLLVDACATLEDVALALDDLSEAIAASQSLVADSRRLRRIRRSRLRAVVAED